MGVELQSREKTVQKPSIALANAGILQRKCDRCHEKEKILQRSAIGSAPEIVPPIVHQVLRSPGQPLDRETRAFFEPRFGHDFSKVRVHTDANADDSVASVNARAYTVGKHIVFGEGEYAPSSEDGRKLLAHELVHTIQQDAMGICNVLQCACRQHNNENFYKISPNYCKDTGFSGLFHGGSCFREIPHRSDYFACHAGEHVCFDNQGRCNSHTDKISPVEGKESDGTCNLHQFCMAEHGVVDLAPWLTKKLGERPLDCLRLAFPLIDPKKGEFAFELEHQCRYLFGQKVQPLGGLTLGTRGLGLQAGIRLEPLIGIGLYLEGRGSLRSEWFKRVEAGGGAEVGLALTKARTVSLGISWDIWQSLAENERRNKIALTLGFKF